MIKNYLHAYISYMQDNWINHLSTTEFAANNHVNVSIEISSFFANNRFYLCTGIELPQIYKKTSQKAELLNMDQIVVN